MNAKVVNIGNPFISLELSNSSSHIITGIEINHNNETVFSSVFLLPNEESIFELPITKSRNEIIVNAKYHFPITTTLNVNLDDFDNIESKQKFSFTTKWDPFRVSKTNILELKVCNSDDPTNLNVKLEENSFFDIENDSVELLIDSDECNISKFVVIPREKGNINIKFILYNDFYNNEIIREVEIK